MLHDLVTGQSFQTRLPDRLETDEVDRAAARLLVGPQRQGERLAAQVRRHLGRQSAALEQPPDALVVGVGAEAETARDARRGDHPDRHRLAVQILLVLGQALEPVGDRVAEVQDGAIAALGLVLADDECLQRAAHAHDPRQELALEVLHGRQLVLDQREQPRIEDDAVLDDLREAGDELAARQRTQRLDVGEHEARLREGAEQVLAGDVVDPGLAADRRIHLREERRRHLHARDAAQIRRRREAGEIADDAAAERDHGAAALDAGVDELVVDEREPREVLVLLAVGDLDGGRLERSVAQGRQRPIEIQISDRRVRHHRHSCSTPRLGELRPELAQTSGADVDRIPPCAELYVDDFHCCRSRSNLATRSQISSTTSSGRRSVVSTVRSATASYDGRRSASSRSIAARGSPPARSGRCVVSPTRRRIVSALAVRQTTTPASRSRAWFAASSTAPPPTAITASRRAAAVVTASRSWARNAASPSSAKIAATLFPASRSTSWSVSTKARPSRVASRRPTSLFPVPMTPVSTIAPI